MPTFYDRFIQCTERWPTNVAVEVQRPDGLESYTFRELRHMAEAIACWLAGRGTLPGQRIAILADNHARWIAGYLGIIAAGGTTVPLDTAYHADQVAKLLEDSGSALLICDQKHFAVAREAVEGREIGMVLTDSGHAREARPEARGPAPVDREGRASTPADRQAEADFDSFGKRRAASPPYPASPMILRRCFIHPGQRRIRKA